VTVHKTAGVPLGILVSRHGPAKSLTPTERLLMIGRSTFSLSRTQTDISPFLGGCDLVLLQSPNFVGGLVRMDVHIRTNFIIFIIIVPFPHRISTVFLDPLPHYLMQAG
jgi:hypothetical protein